MAQPIRGRAGRSRPDAQLGQLAGYAKTSESAGLAVVELDDDGNVLAMNDAAKSLCNVGKMDPVGRPFFVAVAPWAANQVFSGRFRRGVDDDAMDETFRYMLTYLTSPKEITVRLYRDGSARRNWVLMGPTGQSAASS